MTVMVWVMVTCAVMPAVALAQIPGLGSMIPDKAQLLEQARPWPI
jgi:hypothetical protein